MIETSEKAFTPSEVARIFSVDPKTVAKWASAGKIPHFRTPGGHRRFWESDVMKFLEETGAVAVAEDEEFSPATPSEPA